MGDLAALSFLCPECRRGGLTLAPAPTCDACGATFPSLDGRPVLLRRDHPLFPSSAYAGRRPARRRRAVFLPANSVNRSSKAQIVRLAREVASGGRGRLLVVGGGGQRREVESLTAGVPGLALWFCDVDPAADVDFFCDAHELPFTDQSFDGVLTTAVLEHVLEPETAVQEIARVLRPGGAVYSEIPFLQRVHEGAYDFTRFTHSGHRWLFRGFEEHGSGVVAGPGSALAWAIEGFAAALAPVPALRLPFRGVARLVSFWLRFFDHAFGDGPAAVDAACCTWFYGRRRASGETTAKEIVERYAGAQRRVHV